MENIVSIIVSPTPLSPALVIGAVIGVAALAYIAGRRQGRAQTAPVQDAFNREMLRMRRHNVTLAEERDQLQESVDRERRRGNQRRTSEEAL
ncbi:MAG: hypothetical protein AAF371_05705 [Pseudomonadota bacterium]